MDGPTPDEVHVWLWHLDDVAPRLEGLPVTGDERAEAAGVRHERDRLRVLLARGLLRETLAAILRAPALSLAFGRACPVCDSREHGKPYLVAPHGADALRFNLSHAGDLVALAVARGREVGIDVERHDARAEVNALAPLVFSPRERARDEPAPREAFFARWVRKEAYLKMEGHGLAVPLADVDVSDVPPEGGHFQRVVGAPGTPCLILPLPVPLGYAGAIAVEGRDCRLVMRDAPRSNVA